MKDPVFPVFAALGTFLPLIPLIWHWRMGNWAMIFLMIWISVANGIMFINTVIWYRTVDIIAPVWCDIATRIYLMSGIAVPTAILCIARRLEAIASTRQVSQTKTDIRQRAILEFAMCLGVPVIFGVLSTVYWGHRFDLYEGMGCFSAIYVSWPWVVFNLVPVLLTSVLSLAYSLLALRWFIYRRRQFTAVLASSGAQLNQSRYLRMMAFCAVDIVVTLPISIYNTATLLRRFEGHLLPYTSWSDVHAGYATILQIPAYLFDEGELLAGTFSRFDLNRWVSPLSAIIFVSIFGFSHDALQTYQSGWHWILRKITPHRLRDGNKQARPHRMSSRAEPLAVNIVSTVQKSPDEELGYELKTPTTPQTFT